jgi:hypothetical protein
MTVFANNKLYKKGTAAAEARMFICGGTFCYYIIDGQGIVIQ